MARQASASRRSSAPAPFGGAPFTSSSATPAATSRLRRNDKSGLVASALDLLGLVQRALCVEPPERDLGMDLEDAPGQSRIVAQQRVDLADFRRQHEQLLRYLARRLRAGERDPAGIGIVLGRKRRPRRDRKHRRLSCAEKGPHGILGRPATGARALRQADRNIDRDYARRLGRGEHVGKTRHDAYPDVAADGWRKCRDPAGPAAVHAREPQTVRGVAHA